MKFYPNRNRFSLQIKKLIGFRAGKLSFYELALIPRSSSQVTDDNILNNERLEFLGDAVLETIITDYLYQKYPDENEGFLTNARSKFVNRENLNDIGKRLGLEEFVKPPVNHNLHGKNFLGNALEALIGAIYLDKGFRFAKKFIIQKLIDQYMGIDFENPEISNYKSQIIEWGQKNKKDLYFETNKKGTDTNPLFVSHFLLDGKKISSGKGKTKKEAEQNAAKMALDLSK
ncbi:MAG: ribonuclease III [Bacteroidota bacterium]|nr:ribonuclease III [Bacteroidota bacterium]